MQGRFSTQVGWPILQYVKRAERQKAWCVSLPVSAAQRQTHTPEAAAGGTHSPCAQHVLHPELAASQSLAFCTNGKLTLAGI